MAKVKIGSIKHKVLVEGDENLLVNNEILVTESDGYTILREKVSPGSFKTYIVVPLKDFIVKSNNSQTN